MLLTRPFDHGYTLPRSIWDLTVFVVEAQTHYDMREEEDNHTERKADNESTNCEGLEYAQRPACKIYTLYRDL